MKQTGIFLLIVFLILACSKAQEQTSSYSATSTAQVIDGEKIYKQYCVTCHGLYGDMGASGAFNLTTSELSVQERIEVITNGRNTMTPFKTLLSPEKIKAVAEYTLELKVED